MSMQKYNYSILCIKRPVNCIVMVKLVKCYGPVEMSLGLIQACNVSIPQ